MLKSTRRVVTGHDSLGKSVVVSDGAPPQHHSMHGPGVGADFHEMWSDARTVPELAAGVASGKLEIKSVREGEGRMPMQFAVPGVSGEDLSALKAWYWSDDLSVDAQAAIFHIEVRSYLLNVDGLNVLIDTCCGNDKQRCCRWSRRGLPTSWTAMTACIARSKMASGSRTPPAIRPAASS
jgi:hypothetical protein